MSQDELNRQYHKAEKFGSGLYVCEKCGNEFAFISIDAVERIACPECMSVNTKPKAPIRLTDEVYQGLKAG